MRRFGFVEFEIEELETLKKSPHWEIFLSTFKIHCIKESYKMIASTKCLDKYIYLLENDQFEQLSNFAKISDIPKYKLDFKSDFIKVNESLGLKELTIKVIKD